MKYFLMDSHASPRGPGWDTLNEAYLELSQRHLDEEELAEHFICGYENGRRREGPYPLKEFLDHPLLTPLTANTHHLVRETLLDSRIINLEHKITKDSDELRLELDNGYVVVISGQPLDLRFDENHPL